MNHLHAHIAVSQYTLLTCLKQRPTSFATNNVQIVEFLSCRLLQHNGELPQESQWYAVHQSTTQISSYPVL